MLSAMAIFAAFPWEAPAPQRAASMTVTSCPRCASSNALVSPTTPPPTMTVFIRSPSIGPPNRRFRHLARADIAEIPISLRQSITGNAAQCLSEDGSGTQKTPAISIRSQGFCI